MWSKKDTNDPLEKFYQTKRWKKARAYVVARDHGVCVRCGAAGYTVHHIIPLTIANMNDIEIAIGDKNLETLCRSCHESIHSRSAIREDIKFLPNGDMISKGTPPV